MRSNQYNRNHKAIVTVTVTIHVCMSPLGAKTVTYLLCESSLFSKFIQITKLNPKFDLNPEFNGMLSLRAWATIASKLIQNKLNMKFDLNVSLGSNSRM